MKLFNKMNNENKLFNKLNNGNKLFNKLSVQTQTRHLGNPQQDKPKHNNLERVK